MITNFAHRPHPRPPHSYIQRTHHKPEQLPINIDDFPSFEEAFNPISLKKFFHDHDSNSISPQTGYSTNHDASTIEAHSSADPNELALSPLIHEPPKFKDGILYEHPTSESNYNFRTISMNRSDKNCEEKESRQDGIGFDSQPMSPRSTFTAGVANPDESSEDVQIVISRFINNLAENLKGSDGTSMLKMSKRDSMVDEEAEKKPETGFEKLLKMKKVFTIERNGKPAEESSVLRKRSATQDLSVEEPLKVQKVRRFSFKILKDTSNIMKKEKEEPVVVHKEDNKENNKKNKEAKVSKRLKEKKEQNENKLKKNDAAPKRRKKSFKSSSPLSDGDESDS